VGYRGRRVALNVAGRASADAGRSGYLHVAIVDGHVVGSWRRRLTATAMTIDLRPTRTVTDAERATLLAAADRYGRFVELPATVDVQKAG
jgi:hypothetical protein